MTYFVNGFTFGEDASYRAIIAADAAGEGFIVAGTFADSVALLASIDADGRTVWQKTYTVANRPLRFWSGVRCPNGDLMVHGSLVTSVSQSHALVMRLTPAGEVIWANSYARDRTRINIRLVRGSGDTYIFAGWYNERGTTDDVEVARIDGKGKVLAALSIHTSGDDQLNSLIPYAGGCVLAGGSNGRGTWDCFVVALDDKLNLSWKRVIGNSQFQQAVDIVHTSPPVGASGPKFVIAGETGDGRRSFVAELTPDDTEVTGQVYRFRPQSEVGGRRLLKSGGPTNSAGNILLAATVNDAPRGSFVACFDPSLELLWQRELALPGSTALIDIKDAGDAAGGLAVCGVVAEPQAYTRPLLAYADGDLASCVTRDRPLPEPARVRFDAADWAAQIERVTMEVTSRRVTVRSVTPILSEICPSGIGIELEGARVQSPYIYLQAAGSDFSDRTVRGFHLRWDLLRSLGKAHLPKGNLAAPNGPWAATIGYNRADDFVRIFRTAMKSDYGVDVDFAHPPSALFESGAFREWLYEDLVPSAGRTTDVSIRFADLPEYDAVRQTIDPHSAPRQFIAAYRGVVEARAIGKLAFSVAIPLVVSAPTGPPHFRLEALTLPDPLDNTSRRIGCRRTFAAAVDASIVGENIDSVRFDYSGLAPTGLHIATYDDFLHTSNARREWEKVGDYSLDDGNADANTNVFRRLEESPDVVVDNLWPKFQQVSDPGVFRVNAQSYRDRWLLPADGLKQGVITYLDASRTAVGANVVVANSDPVTNLSTTELSYLDLLNFVSLDFHVARMLGLGTIDPSPTAGSGARFIYLMQYVTEAQLEHETASTVRHCFMTPPVRITDHRPPPPPAIALSYGLPPEECEGTTSALTDANGYAVFDQIRFVNLDRARFRHEMPMEGFFQTADEFNLYEETTPVGFGVRYGAGAVGAGNDVRPELSHNDAWLDSAGYAEVAPIPERGSNPVYTHGERSAGVHHYQLYSINIFSRTAGASNEVQTDATVFAPRNTLLPPSNLAVQLIQKEEPRIFTSADEQLRLAQLPAGDQTLLRVTFDWNDVQNRAYFGVDTVELYFRTLPPQVVRGEIAAVADHPSTHTTTVTTKSYPIASTKPPQIVQPEIAAADVQRYVGARLTANGQSWVVESVTSSGPNPTLVLQQIRTTASVDADHDNSFCTVEKWSSPHAGDRFLMAENLDNPAVWDTKLTKEVSLAQFSPPFMEFIVNNDGQGRSVVVGGIADSATVVAIPDLDPGVVAAIPAGGPSSVPSGAYTITLANRQLAASSDPDVELCEGIVRLPDLNGKTKVLRVWNVDNSGATLQVIAYDAELGLQRDPVSGKFLLAGTQFVPVDGYVPVQTGSVAVNFHPSYRVYLTADVTTPGHNFGEPAVLPARGEGSRQTLFTVRSRATAASLTSRMSKPAVILAQELREPVAPGPLRGPLFATRPNFFGKATFTVDVQVDDPYALVFYKANDRKIIDQLYEPKTAREIVARLEGMSDFEKTFEPQRWSDLVHVVTDANDEFVQYVLDGFRFPPPNDDTYVIPDPSLDPPVFPFALNNTTPPGSSAVVPGTGGRTMKSVVQEAVEKAFVPITELPLIYQQLNDKTLQTSGRPPKLRSPNGQRLPPDDADPWPMAVRYEKNANGDVMHDGDPGHGSATNTRWVRITDYTIDGASTNVYFYFAVELSSTMKVSARSPITGPVQLVNAAPPEAPVIRKVTAQLDDGAGATPRVDFLLSGYLPSEGVTSYKLYRSLDADDALNVRTMTEVREFMLGDPVFDDFADLGYVPFAQPIHYRVLAFRSIINEQGLPERIPSKPSEMATARVADTVNPEPPQITMTSDPLSLTHPFQYANVQLSWPRTTYNGTYHLYKLNDVGMWVKIASVGDAAVMQVKLQDTTLGTGVLLKENSAGNPFYHRFRVLVVNSSGLVNLKQNELTV